MTGRTLTALLGLALMLPIPAALHAHEPPPIVPLCALCHGEEGPSPFPGVPTIHGLPAISIEVALHHYREGERPCRKSRCSEEQSCPDMNMCDIAAPMSDEDIDLLAYWFSQQPFAMHQDPYDPELAARGRQIHDRYCEVCHTQYGSEPVDQASMLRGQRKVYLRTALEDFQQGRRSIGIATMDARFKTFSDQDLDALAEFYSGPAPDPLPGE